MMTSVSICYDREGSFEELNDVVKVPLSLTSPLIDIIPTLQVERTAVEIPCSCSRVVLSPAGTAESQRLPR